MNHCKNCRWWDARKADDGWGFCTLAESGCHYDDPHERLHPETLAVAQDASRYHAVLVTSPDFGCVQWSAT